MGVKERTVLTLYRRHLKECEHAERPRGTPAKESRKCSCPIWIQGSHEGRSVRKSLEVSSWARAEAMKREIEDGGPAAPVPSISEASMKFLNDAEHGRRLAPATLKKYRVLLDQLAQFAGSRGVSDLSGSDVDFAREFRASWKDGPISSSKKLERLSAFFRFCRTAGWIESNPAADVAKPKTRTAPTMPFDEREVDAVLRHATDPRWHALVQVLRWTGLRIGDAVKLTEDRIEGNRLFLYTAKSGTPVWVPLPDFVVSELEALPKFGGHYFWKREGESKIDTASGNARRSLRKVFKSAGIKGHPHRFRDSFAVGLLEQGVPLETVSVLLGHASVRVTQKHYAPWVKSLQQNLERAVASSWLKAKAKPA